MQLAVTTDGLEPKGEVLLFQDELDDRDVELAYGIGARFRRQGLAAEAVMIATEYAIRQLGARRVLLRIDVANVPSAAVAASSGFQLTADEPIERRSKGRRVLLRTWCRHS